VPKIAAKMTVAVRLMIVAMQIPMLQSTNASNIAVKAKAAALKMTDVPSIKK
jgi:hypothetical protein